MSIIGGEQMSQFYCREDELRKLNKRYAGDKKGKSGSSLKVDYEF